MRKLLQILSFVGLLLNVSPAFLHFYGVIEFQEHKWITLLGTALYLGSAPFWMNKKKAKTS